MKLLITPMICLLLLALPSVNSTLQAAPFSYQGRLDQTGEPAEGAFDFKFQLHTTEVDGVALAELEKPGLVVSKGLFNTELDFGGPAVFAGGPRWISVWVRAAGAADYTEITPRQPVRSVPLAMRAEVAAAVESGSITTDSLAPNSVTLNQLSTVGAPGVGMMLGFDGANLTWLTPSGGNGNGGGSLTLPFSGIGNSTGALFTVNNMNATGDSWAIFGHSQQNIGVFGQTHGNAQAGVLGRNDGATGVNGAGVFGYASTEAHGVLAISEGGNGIWAATNAPNRASVYAQTHQPTSVAGNFRHLAAGTGMFADSAAGDGVVGVSAGAGKGGVVGINNQHDGLGALVGLSSSGSAVFAKTDSITKPAGFFWNSAGGDAIRTDGNVRVGGRTVTRVLEITGGSDVAEPFAMEDAGQILPGHVVVISDQTVGKLELSRQAYDKRVAGIVSGANGVQPGLRLRQDGAEHVDGKDGRDVALTGRVWCFCDAMEREIEPGDLLTTSATPGHAMAADSPEKASGAVLGKAMSRLEKGSRGYVLVLVSLQ